MGLIWSMAEDLSGGISEPATADPLPPAPLTIAAQAEALQVVEIAIDRLRLPIGVERVPVRERGLVGRLLAPERSWAAPGAARPRCWSPRPTQGLAVAGAERDRTWPADGPAPRPSAVGALRRHRAATAQAKRWALSSCQDSSRRPAAASSRSTPWRVNLQEISVRSSSPAAKLTSMSRVGKSTVRSRRARRRISILAFPVS